MNDVVKWPGRILFGFGIANMLLVAAGAVLTAQTLSSFRPVYTAAAPYTVQAFRVMVSINVLFLLSLAVTGRYLIKRDMRIIRFCNILFCIEPLYFVAVALMWLNSKYGMSVGTATGVANEASTIQLITGYPIIALVLLNIARLKGRVPVPASPQS
jgi:hypothetical protein